MRGLFPTERTDAHKNDRKIDYSKLTECLFKMRNRHSKMNIVLSLTILFTAIMNNGIFALAKSSSRS